MPAEYSGERVNTNDNQIKKYKMMLASRDSEIRDLKYQIGELLKLHAEREASLFGKMTDLQNSLKWYKSKRVTLVRKPRASVKADAVIEVKEAENEESD
jgi:hypothetical protein